MKLNWLYKNPINAGILGALALLLFYFIILTIANSPSHAVQQFLDMWYWVVTLAIGFGIQIGLYVHITNTKHQLSKGATASVATSGGMSTVSMAACCAHHLTDVLPLLGLAAAATFLVKYQTLFLLIGVVSNLIGITMMLKIIKKEKLSGNCSILKKITKYDMNALFKLVLAIGAGIIFGYWLIML